jgi:hypothetical protein
VREEWEMGVGKGLTMLGVTGGWSGGPETGFVEERG